MAEPFECLKGIGTAAKEDVDASGRTGCEPVRNVPLNVRAAAEIEPNGTHLTPRLLEIPTAKAALDLFLDLVSMGRRNQQLIGTFQMCGASHRAEQRGKEDHHNREPGVSHAAAC